jgi:hypothetical protein
MFENNTLRHFEGKILNSLILLPCIFSCHNSITRPHLAAKKAGNVILSQGILSLGKTILVEERMRIPEQLVVIHAFIDFVHFFLFVNKDVDTTFNAKVLLFLMMNFLNAEIP